MSGWQVRSAKWLYTLGCLTFAILLIGLGGLIILVVKLWIEERIALLVTSTCLFTGFILYRIVTRSEAILNDEEREELRQYQAGSRPDKKER